MENGSNVGNVQLMQKINRLKVLKLIRQRGEISRPEISRETGLSPSSVTNVISHFMDISLVKELGPVDSKEVGRKAVLIRFNADSSLIVAVDIDISRVIISLTNMEGDIRETHEMAVPPSVSNYGILDLIQHEIARMISPAANGAGALPTQGSDRKIGGIGIAVSGAVQDSDRLVISSSLKWTELPIKEYYEAAFHIPVFVENNSKTKVLYTFRNKDTRLEKNVIFLDLSSGIGIVHFYNHKINPTITGEIGHTSVKKDGPLCFCGNRGCLELMCSVKGIVARVSELLAHGKCPVLRELLAGKEAAPDFPAILKAEKGGDRDVCRIIRQNGEYLGIGIANIINLFHPQRIAINGDQLFQSDLLYQTAISVGHQRAFKDFVKDTVIEKINISTEDAIKGISLNVVDKLFELSEGYWEP